MDEQEVLNLFHDGSCFSAHKFFGCHQLDEGGCVFRVWAPHALKVSVVGTFNDWNDSSSYMSILSDGESYEVEIPNAKAGDKYNFCIFTRDGRNRLLFIRYPIMASALQKI
jgi:1,4-alpha-glucan branching enzyme